MALFGALNYILGMDTKGWTKGAESAGKDVDKLKGHTDGLLSSLHGFKKTGLGESLELAVGGGALRVISHLGREIEGMAKKIADVNAQIKAGTADSGDMFEAIAGGLPVIGEFWKAGREIREAFTGDKAEIDEANKALKQMGDTIAVIKKIKLDELGYEISVTKEIEKQLYLRSLIGL